jgi:hypothetical protein
VDGFLGKTTFRALWEELRMRMVDSSECKTIKVQKEGRKLKDESIFTKYCHDDYK